MDPVGPWSAYAASYNRLAGATGGFQSGSAGGAGDFVASHHHLAAATGNSGLGSHQPGGGVPSTTSQLLLQAAHTTASLAGQLGMSAAGPGTTASPFNPGGFLSPPPVGYDAVFSPLFHHANPKPAHYPSTLNVSQHRQALAQAQAAATKQSSVESELSSLRENYSTAHHQSLAASGSSFFEHQASSSSPSSSLAWSHQSNTQLPSPFGILPHETVVTSSPGPVTSKSGTATYETFNAHFAAAQSLNHLNSQLTAAAEYNKSSGSYGDNSSKKASRAQSPLATPVKPVASAASNVSASGTPFFHQASTGTSFTGSESLTSRGDCSSLSGNFSSSNKSQQQQQQQISSGSEFSSGSKSFGSNSSSSLHHQQSCIVSTASSTSASSKDYRIPQPPSRSASTSLFLNAASTSSRSSSQASEKQSSRNQNFVPPTSKSSAHHTVQTKAQTKIYPELPSSSEHSRRNESTLESSQSSPISFAMMDANTHRQGLNYSGNTAAGGSCSSASGSSSKMASNPQRNSTSSNLQQSQFPHVLNQQATASSSYHARHYSGSVSTADSSDYHHGGRSKASGSTDSSYSERLLASNNSSSQNGPDCGVVVPRRPSPLQAHSQASPLGHVPSPAYPMYNSPMPSMSSPSPLQQHSEPTANQCASGGAPRHNNPQAQQQQQVAPPSPLDVTVPRPSSQGSQVAYPSVITRALSGEGGNKSYGGEGRSFERSQQQQQQQEFAQKQQGCWETGDSRQQPHHSRPTNKYQASSGYGAGGMEMSQQVPAQQQQAQQRAALGISERQQAYFDSSPGHQVTLQDLSSCRGDPMSIVKNLQTLQQQQQSCQLQPNADQPKSVSEERLQTTKSSSGGGSSGGGNSGASGSGSSSSGGKRRKSSEKSHAGASSSLSDIAGSAMAEYFTGRVPPPAHHNTNQQQQNGGFFDFERWNLPPPPPKMFGGGPGAFGSQSPLHHGGNFVGNPAHQHQSLMVPHPHHHPPPPLPYFPAFQLHPGHHPHHPPHEFQPSVEIAPLPFENNSSGNSSFATGQETRDDQPKVIVPNIEEELGFLAGSDTAPATTTTTASTTSTTNPASSTVTPPVETKIPEKKSLPSNNPSSGFMASYMKFLQGERDSSPPPANRGGRKATWSRAKVYQPEPAKSTATTTTAVTATTAVTTTTTALDSGTTASTDGNATPTPTSSVSASEKPKEVTTVKSKEISNRVYDPEDDPRYFPLPKSDAKRKSFADSDGDFDSSDGEKEKVIEKEKPKQKEKEKGKEKEKEDSKPLSKLTSKQSKPSLKAASTKTPAPPATPQVELTGSKAGERAEKPEKGKKGRGPKSGGGQAASKRKHDQEEGTSWKRRPRNCNFVLGYKKKSQGTTSVDPLFLPPRRETSRRKAKEKTSMKQLLDRQQNLDEEFDADEPEFVDSDSDPAWTPAAKDSSDEDGAGRRRGSRRTRPLVSRKKSRLLSSSTAGGHDEDGYSSSGSVDAPAQPPPNKRHHANHRSGSAGSGKSGNVTGSSKSGSTAGGAKAGNGGSSKSGSGTGNSKSGGHSGAKSGGSGSNGNSKSSGGGAGGGGSGGGRGRPRITSITTPSSNSTAALLQPAVTEETSGNTGGESSDTIPFKSGEFVVMKTDLGEEYPPIWRIDGKTLLQKYEPFDQNGKTLYRNISTYSGWTPQNRHIYQQVPVKFRVQNRLETIVEFMRDEMALDDQHGRELMEKSMKETAKYQDNFEVYIQTLISQALDSNFLTEIFQEQDDYFLSNVKTVDDVTEERKRRLLGVAQWKAGLQTSVGTWPCFNVISDLPADEKREKLCAACDKSQVSVRVQMYGQPYNSTTLEGCQPDPKVASQKDFLLCSVCVGRVELYNKVAHQKYLMYIECAKRVAEKRSNDPYKDTTIILNELLADEAWLNQLFQSVRTSWAEIDKMEQQAQSKVTS